jgi:peptidylprolyl isomerase
VTGEPGQEAKIATPKGNPPADLYKEDIFKGSGAEAVATSTITVQYTLMSWTTGQIVESSWAQNGPATFQLEGLILGWQQGIPGMREGGRRLLVVPPALGYGDDTLIFVIDLINVG